MEVNKKREYYNYEHKKISKNICVYKHKYTDEVKYFAYVLRRNKEFKTLKEAQKFVDLVLSQNKKPQIYNSFKQI